MITVKDWAERAAALRDELVAAGKLTSPEWQAALLAVPRHQFVPQFYERGPDPVGPRAWELVSASSPETRERWWHGVWANTSLVTQLGEVGCWGQDTVAGPASSSSAPSLMTRMLEALDIRDEHRVLEIGTGTGYNAAPLSHRLDDQHVFSVDVDPELVDHAYDRLAALGYRPILATVDGVTGLPQHASYDRVIATCAVSWVPWSWAEQITEGGLILVDVEPRTGPARNRENARRATTTLVPERLWENLPLWFLVHLHQRGRVGFGYAKNPGTGGPGPVFFSTADGSWCELSTAEEDGTRHVGEGGPRNLWASIQATKELWHQHGAPGWDRFGLTVTPARHTIWLDTPDSNHQWLVC